MNEKLEKDLRLILFKEYGFEKILDNFYIDKSDLTLIRENTVDIQLKNRLGKIIKKRNQSELVEASKKYNELKDKKGWAVSLLKNYYLNVIMRQNEE
ncbi:hypothetical protein [Liquorilactobacillus cacaonum]|uniref:Uncharacterized protein n=1 Tax=Liquorilactobacillus cacaonum DSM 21116 TaxID=1423729 RepID=A0A0R2CNM6_9LACO|nr:hypothetical protein [Liquorilactobacillus cacaonum]KRM90105.1 hypothetical protein FC80_GL001442 [Liquorilactobacillus cacaonum DSM 21116]